MTTIEVVVNPVRRKSRQEEVAEEFLSDRGFERGQHYETEAECFSLAAKVSVELSIRGSQNEWGFYDFEVDCIQKWCRPECRGWDGKSKRCDCGAHLIQLIIVEKHFPEVEHRIECCCCDFCEVRPFEQKCKSGDHRYCCICSGGHHDACSCG